MPMRASKSLPICTSFPLYKAISTSLFDIPGVGVRSENQEPYLGENVVREKEYRSAMAERYPDSQYEELMARDGPKM